MRFLIFFIGKIDYIEIAKGLKLWVFMIVLPLRRKRSSMSKRRRSSSSKRKKRRKKKRRPLVNIWTSVVNEERKG
jgi:prophage antirepressor-like protein